MRQRRLLWYLFPFFLILTIAVLLAITWYASHSFRVFYYRQVAVDLGMKARLVEPQILPMIKDGNFGELDNICKRLHSAAAIRISVILPDGWVVADSDENPAVMKNHGDRPEFKDALAKGSGVSLRYSATLGKKMMYLAIPMKQEDKEDKIASILRISIPVTAVDEELSRIYKKIIWGCVFIAIFAAAVALAISKKISYPVEQMKEIAKRFASGELDIRLAVPNVPELAELAKALNEMAEQLSDRIAIITKERNETQAILSSMIEGVLAVDSNGYIVSVNKAAAMVLNVEPESAKGRNVEEIFRNQQLRQFIEDTLASEQPAERDIVLAGEEERYVRLRGTGLNDSGGKRSGAVIVLNDMTRMRHLEDMRRDFVGNVSHELKTPVTSIKGFVETLLDGAINEPEQANRFLRIIAKQSDRLNAIIEDLLSLSRLEEEQQRKEISFELCKIRPVLEDAVELSGVKASGKQILLTVVCEDNIEGRVNPALLEQAVTNLIDNAVKYSENGKEVKIEARKEDSGLAISVKDDGCGIAQQHLSRIFERFYVVDKSRSRSLGGTGLGLSIVKHIAQVHGGSVTVESSLGKGSRFTIHLPKN